MVGVKKNLISLVLIMLSLLIGLTAGFILGRNWKGNESALARGKAMRLSGYKFISPLLACEGPGEGIEYKELRPFKHKIEALINEKQNIKLVNHVSVYFRDLNNGPSFGINAKERFSPASLLKVPHMIAILKEAESHPQILKRMIKYENIPDFSAQQNIKSSKSIEYAKSYTVEELLYRMIVYSDNNAHILLSGIIDPEILKKTYIDLGTEVPPFEDQGDFMSVRQYASFFRILFNASYLNREMSEKALEYLSETEFNDGIVGGVPSNVTVAHKFGERTAGVNDEIKQLHDCGIIYYPDHPYLLCVMSMGDSFEYLDDTIREVSRLVYQEIDHQFRNK